MQTLKEKLQAALEILNSGDTEFVKFTSNGEAIMPIRHIGAYLSDITSIGIRRKPQWQLTNQLPGFRALEEGEEWHTTEGWVEADLPAGYRPLLKGETRKKQDTEVCTLSGKVWNKTMQDGRVIKSHERLKGRTTRPLPVGVEELAKAMSDKYASEVSRHKGWIAAAKRAKELLTPQP